MLKPIDFEISKGLSTGIVNKMKSATLVLPWAPSINHYKKIGGIVRTKTGKIYQKRHNSVATMVFYFKTAQVIRQEGLIGAFRGTIPLSVEIDLYPPDKRARDIDNLAKCILDGLQHGKLYDNDNQVARLLITRCATIPKGEIVVRISEIEK